MRWILFVVVYLAFGYYVLHAVKTVFRQPWLNYVYIGLALLILINFIYQYTVDEETGKVLSRSLSYAFGFMLAMITFQVVMILFLFSEDICRFVTAAYHKITGSTTEFTLPQRRRFITGLALGLASIPFAGVIYGMYKGKYRFRVLEYDMEYDDLPEAFDGYRIIQISDIHSGSFDNYDKIAYGVNLINEQKGDVILFTGDMVNNKADEMLPWKQLFGSITAKDGKFSVLGNHDYGDYIEWETEALKAKNLEDLKDLQREMGFDLLLNEHRYLRKGYDKIALIGVENWGSGGFIQAGDLAKASANVDPNDFKIVMSHDPSHWEAKILPAQHQYHLTLSGHTHGMQFGIEIPGVIKWSPAQWRYKQWAGIYEEMGQYINVNRGFGYLGYPGRIGIWPEITAITLRKKKLS